jgi:hypothetical protein
MALAARAVLRLDEAAAAVGDIAHSDRVQARGADSHASEVGDSRETVAFEVSCRVADVHTVTTGVLVGLGTANA